MTLNFGNRIEFAVSRWAAWAPGIESADAWEHWAVGEREIAPGGAPDVKFVAPMMRRRLSLLTRMVFRVAMDCLNGTELDLQMAYVFCSRYGEYDRTFAILQDLAHGEPASALAFSMSVHNTAASLFAIDRGDRSASITLAGGPTTLEAACVDAWSQLAGGEAASVLLVYADTPLPDLYREWIGGITHPFALALLLRSAAAGEAGSQLSLTWRKRATGAAPPTGSILDVLRLILSPAGVVAVDDGRLVWQWCKCPADA